MSHTEMISAIVPVGKRFDSEGTLAREYLDVLDKTGRDFELIFVLSGPKKPLIDRLADISESDERLRIIKLAKGFGEATALSAGIENANGDLFVTLPAYYQIDPKEIPALLVATDDCDMVVAARSPRASKSGFEVFRRKAFHWMLKIASGSTFMDLGCGVRAFNSQVAEEIPLYGDQHRFLPLLAIQRGFRVQELKLRQSELDRYDAGYSPKEYLHRLLDILTVVFLVRFTKKPLRFFGMIGSVTFLIGAITLIYIVIERLFFDQSLADRPALLLSSLFVVLGLQIFALGLLGELIIFTHARNIKEYTIEKIVN